MKRSDLAALAATEGRFEEALAGWPAALEIDPDCLMVRLNRDLIEAELSFGHESGPCGQISQGSDVLGGQTYRWGQTYDQARSLQGALCFVSCIYR